MERLALMLALLGSCASAAGLVVHIGCGDGTALAKLQPSGNTLVHGLEADAATVVKARAQGRTFVEHWPYPHLPYVDNLVNRVIADDLGVIPMSEVMRVLAPGGVAVIGGKETVKPWPKNIDEWTHYLYDPTNNAVAQDTAVGPPRRVQWKAGPVFARHHDNLASVTGMVSAEGKLFSILDEGQTSLMHLPSRWRLVARDAFNGVLLWKRDIPTWENPLRAFRSGPPQFPRRLVAVGDRVYVTLGLTAPVSALDVATGKTLTTYPDTAYADEILCLGDTLLVVTFDYGSEEEARQALRRGVPTNAGPRAIVAVDAKTGKTLWRKAGADTAGLMPTTLAASGGRVVYQCGMDVACADLATGKILWRRTTKPATAKPHVRKRRSGLGAAFYSPTLVVSGDVVLSATGATLTALSLADGRVLWTGKSRPDFNAPADLFVADGLVWSGLFAAEGLDLATGKVKRT
ncbi:PQQ-binding-like beta-propeller repeat protein, partial [bacterium]|nr:PQQ-binding-like beta-propeller repeat protein [bacterium]